MNLVLQWPDLFDGLVTSFFELLYRCFHLKTVLLHFFNLRVIVLLIFSLLAQLTLNHAFWTCKCAIVLRKPHQLILKLFELIFEILNLSGRIILGYGAVLSSRIRDIDLLIAFHRCRCCAEKHFELVKASIGRTCWWRFDFIDVSAALLTIIRFLAIYTWDLECKLIVLSFALLKLRFKLLNLSFKVVYRCFLRF